MTSEHIINDALWLSMEFGKNWLQPIHKRLAKKYPTLTQSELDTYNRLCQEISKKAHKLILTLPAQKNEQVEFMSVDQFRTKMRQEYPFIDARNMRRLYSQSCYYVYK